MAKEYADRLKMQGAFETMYEDIQCINIEASYYFDVKEQNNE